MARTEDTSPTATLANLLPDGWLQRTAREVGAQSRRRKVDVVALFWTVVLGFGVAKKRSMAELRRSYVRAAGGTIEESSFYDRFTDGFTELLRRAVSFASESMHRASGRASKVLAAFTDVLAIDSTVIRLHDLLMNKYPACRTNSSKSAAKLHMVMSVTQASAQQIRLTDERVNDRTPWRRIGKWVAGRLLLFDLGYFGHHLFALIDDNRGYFISRLKKNSNPTIVSTNRAWRGRARALVGERLQDVTAGLERGVIDVMARMAFERRGYRGKRRSDEQTFRVVGIHDAATSSYHFYVTNIPVDTMEAKDIAETYRLRWQVELLFKELKSHYRIDQLPSRKKRIVEALIHAALLTLLASRALLNAIRAKLPPGRHVPPLRWGAVFAALAPELLQHVVTRLRGVARIEDPWALLLAEAVDPNVGRPAASAKLQRAAA